MPRDATSELAYVQLTANPANITNSAASIAGLGAIGYLVEQLADPLLIEAYFPQITISSLNATLTINLVDQTVAGQFVTLQTAVLEGVTAAGQTGAPVLVKARFQVQSFPALSVPVQGAARLLAVTAVTSAGTATVVATATAPAYVQILNLGRQ